MSPSKSQHQWKIQPFFLSKTKAEKQSDQDTRIELGSDQKIKKMEPETDRSQNPGRDMTTSSCQESGRTSARNDIYLPPQD